MTWDCCCVWFVAGVIFVLLVLILQGKPEGR